MACSWKLYDCVIEEGGKQFTEGAVVVFAKAIGDGAAEVLKALNGVWLSVDVENPAGNGGGHGQAAAGSAIGKIMAEVDWIVAYVAVASLLLAAIRMAVDRKGQSMRQAFMGMWKVILVGAASVPVVTALMKASDAYAKDVYARSNLGDKATEMLGVLTLNQPGLVLIFGLLVMLSSFVQIVLMYIRIGVLIMLVGTLPLAAASSMTGWGEGWWKKHIGWLAAWLLYKPAAALIIYSATSMTQDTKNLDQVIAGMGMLILAVFALPALLKLIVPATAALGGTSGGTVALGVANNMASGAVSIAGSAVGAAGQSGGGGGGGSTGPQGSPSSGAGSSAGAGAGGAGGAGAAAGTAAAGAATAGAAVAVQAAAVVVQTGMQAASEIAGSLDDNDGMKGHNQ
ncbi:hypothetical protein PV379_41085 [Streptomyces caniscabiei]|uniref:hypothetical protein n=1 Tax=Streptomyces caniscabiei TaxID=2746961 RepID=UPI0029B1981B|nr:hypothetical protein [Streptomyces caniscabiei]MDX2601455.1 hypothetical protein [Streptomyces caniscabiei]MDX2739637.1 hypothetical protein [Streptomyces caniscabiei]MDX2783662.1 hypothetical protein [Streptomyces caniscabiei]